MANAAFLRTPLLGHVGYRTGGGGDQGAEGPRCADWAFRLGGGHSVFKERPGGEARLCGILWFLVLEVKEEDAK